MARGVWLGPVACCSASRSSAFMPSCRARSAPGKPGWQLGTSAPGTRMPSGGAGGVEGACGPAAGARDWELWPVMRRAATPLSKQLQKQLSCNYFFARLVLVLPPTTMGLRFVLPGLGSRKPTPKVSLGHVPPSKASAEAPPPSFAKLIAAGTVVPDEGEGPYALGSYHANVTGKGRGYTHVAGRREWFATNKAIMARQRSWAIDLDHRQTDIPLGLGLGLG